MAALLHVLSPVHGSNDSGSHIVIIAPALNTQENEVENKFVGVSGKKRQRLYRSDKASRVGGTGGSSISQKGVCKARLFHEVSLPFEPSMQ